MGNKSKKITMINNSNKILIEEKNVKKCRLLIFAAIALMLLIPASFALSISNIQVFPRQTNVTINWNTDVISNGTIEVWEGSNVFTASHSSLLTTHTLTPQETLFIDDLAENIAACRYVERVGFVAKTQIPNAAKKGGRHMDVVFYIKEL